MCLLGRLTLFHRLAASDSLRLLTALVDVSTMNDLTHVFSLWPMVAMSTNADALRNLGTNEAITQQEGVHNRTVRVSMWKAALTPTDWQLKEGSCACPFSLALEMGILILVVSGAMSKSLPSIQEAMLWLTDGLAMATIYENHFLRPKKR